MSDGFIGLRCGECGHMQKVSADQAGTWTYCEKCSSPIEIPQAPPGSPAGMGAALEGLTAGPGFGDFCERMGSRAMRFPWEGILYIGAWSTIALSILAGLCIFVLLAHVQGRVDLKLLLCVAGVVWSGFMSGAVLGALAVICRRMRKPE